MKCSSVIGLLEDYHDSEVDDRRAARIASHLRDCEACRRVLTGIQAERQIYQAYAERIERNVTVTPAMWEQVRSQIAALRYGPAPSPRWRASMRHGLRVLAGLSSTTTWVGQAAFAVSLVVLSVTVTLLAVHFLRGAGPEIAKPGLSQSPLPAIEPGRTGEFSRAGRSAADGIRTDAEIGAARMIPAPGRPVSSRRRELQSEWNPEQRGLQIARLKIRRAESDYIDAIRILGTAVNKRKSTLGPRLVLALDQNLLLIDQAIMATRKAYRENPQDPDLAQYMLTAYSRKVQVLEELAFSNGHVPLQELNPQN